VLLPWPMMAVVDQALGSRAPSALVVMFTILLRINVSLALVSLSVVPFLFTNGV